MKKSFAGEATSVDRRSAAMSTVSDWAALIAPVTTMLSGLGGALGGYWLAGRNEEARDTRTGQREETARRAVLTERLEDQRHEIQRETLLELQDELQKLARATVQILTFDRNHPGERLPDDLDDGFSTLSVNRLKTRILDRQLRDGIDAFTAICSRDAAMPRSGEYLSSDDLKAAIAQQIFDLNNGFMQLNEQVGERIRDELDRLGTAPNPLLYQSLSQARGIHGG
jgi:hypothetical protein